MAYNKTSEERKWNYWKEQEEKKLRELGMEEEKIQKLRQMDREDFLEERRYREHLDEMMQDIQNGEYLFKSHDYRHTVATNLYDHGVSRQGIRDYLGHNYEEMTMQYIDYMPKKIARRNEEYFSDEKNSLLSYVQKGEKDERKS